MQLTEFEKLARQLRPDVVSRVMAMTHDADVAEDVAQDTLLRLWQLRDRLDEYRSVHALARVIARNLAIDALRERGESPALSLDDVVEPSDSREADAMVLAREAVAQMDGVLSRLAPAQQAVMRMRHAEGMEMEEIARAIGTTPANVRVLLCRARARVKQIIMKQ